MMGVPWHHRDEILRLTMLMVGGMDPEIQREIDDPIQTYAGAAARMVAIVEEIAEQRRAKPEDDLISALVHEDIDGEWFLGWERTMRMFPNTGDSSPEQAARYPIGDEP
jgi:cytochrome P450